MKYRIGADVGGTSVKVGVVDENFRIVRQDSFRTLESFEESMKALADMIYDLTASMGIEISDLASIGVGVPCSVVQKTGRLVFANNTNWKDSCIRDELKKYIPNRIYFNNDANCAVIGETLAGAARGRKNVVLITIGTGVGGGIIMNGKLYAGADGLGAELGHTPLVFGGIQCTCGLPGCFECYASATALKRQTAEAIENHPESAMAEMVRQEGKVTGKTAFDCAQAGDPAALEVLDRYSSYIAGGLTGFINIFRPELIILGGGLSNAGEPLLDRVRKKIGPFTLGYDVVGGPEICKAELGNAAGIIGAAFQEWMTQQ